MTSFTNVYYLDKEYVSSIYEEMTNEPGSTTVTRGGNVGVGVSSGLFSISGGASESKSFQISTLMMLKEIKKELQRYENLEKSEIELQKPSMTVWVEGVMSIGSVCSYRENSGSTVKELISKASCFQIESSGHKFSLLAVDTYFSSGLFGLMGWEGNILDHMVMPVRALIRIVSARTPDEQWIAIPYLIVDPE